MIGVALKTSLRSLRSSRFYSLALEGARDGAATQGRIGNNKTRHPKQQTLPGTLQELNAQVETLSNTYSSEQLKNILSASASFAFDAPTSELLMNSVLRKAPITDYHDIRAHLATGKNASALRLDEASLDKAVARCVQLGDTAEAMQWLLLAEEAYGTALSQKSRDAVLRASTKFWNWDAVHFLLEDRRSRGESLGADLATSILRGAFQLPSGRWRVAKDLALEMDPSNLTPSALALVFRTLAGASQHKAAHALYHRLVSRVPTGESSPLFAVQVLSPLAVSAHNLKRFSFLRDAIHNCFASLLRASLTASAAAKAEVGGVTSAAPAEHTADAEATWLLRSIDAMCRAYADAPFEIAPAVGGAVGWLLDTGKSESAESLWGSYVSALKERAAESIDDESARLQGAVDEALRLVASVAVESSPGHLRATAAFLRTVVLNPGSTAAASPESLPSDGQTDALTDQMMRIFTITQDLDAVSSLFSRRLQRGGLPAESAMTPALQLIQQRGDHDLVLKLFNYYTSIANPRQPMNKVFVSVPKGATKGTASQRKSLPGAFAPPIFAAAMGSLAETGDIEGMVALLTVEVPSRGFAPREGAYTQAIAALCKRGLYTEGTRLFAQSQQLYGDMVAASRAKLAFPPLGYGVGSVPLVDVALRCCAQGRLGVTALEIFQAVETAHRQGYQPLNASDVDVLSEQVILSLATPDYVQIIPKFLQSHRNLPIKMVTSRKALLTGLAAAMFVGDDAVAAELAQMLEASQGRPLAEITSVDQMQTSIARLFAVKNEAALLCVTGSEVLQRLR